MELIVFIELNVIFSQGFTLESHWSEKILSLKM